MLPIRFRQEEPGHPLQALCPWLDFVTPDIILQKDGSLLAGYSYEGIDPDGAHEDAVTTATTMLERAYSQLDDRITAWWILDKRIDPSYPAMEPHNPVAVALDREYSVPYKLGTTYATTFRFFMLYTPASGASTFFDRVSALRSDGKPLGLAIGDAVKESFSNRSAFGRNIKALKENIAEFRRIMQSFRSAAPIRFVPLRGDDMTDALSALLNRARPPMPRRKPLHTMLDSWLPTDEVKTGTNVIKFQNNKDIVYVGALAMKKWPEGTTPMLFEMLAEREIEMTICQIVRFLGPLRSRAEIDGAIEYYKLTKSGLISHAMAAAVHKEADPAAGKEAMLAACMAAKEELEAESMNYCYHNLTVFVYGRSQKELETGIVTASDELALQGFTVIRETKNTMPSYTALLPGQWSQQVRYDLLSMANLADCSPVYTMLPGPVNHPFFSKDIYQRPVPAFAIFKNKYGGRTYFSPHVDQVGHMLIVAPTGGGKTTFVNFLLSQFQRYQDCQTFIFDRNQSCRIVTELHGGTHIDLKAKSAKFNPFFAMMDGSEDGKGWVREFIIRRLIEGNYIPTPEDRGLIDQALETMEANHRETGDKLRMSMFAIETGTEKMRELLSEWTEGGPYGMFDSDVDGFSLSNWTTIEMLEIMRNERIARAFMDYAFRKIYAALDGRPTFIYLEEASFLLNNEHFAPMLDDWLKTFRKKNAFVWLTLQSPDSITNAKMASTLLDNVLSMLMLHNQKVEAHRELYKKYFGLTDHQINMIKDLVRQREYLLIQGDYSRVIQTTFSPKCLAYLRSEQKVLALFHEHKESGRPDWQERYLEDVANR